MKNTTKRLWGLALAGAMLMTGMTACGNSNTGGNDAGTGDANNASGGKKQIVIISKSFNNQFYQAAFQGALDAGKDFGVEVTTDGPDAESNIPQQVEKVNAAINRKPDAIVLAACDPESLVDALGKAKEKNIPVIGFDSGVPGDTTGAVLATATTDNVKAGGNVAQSLAANADFQAKLKEATEGSPVVVGILAQDVTSGSISQRVDGFVNELKAQLEAMDGFAGAVDISGQQKWTEASTNPAKVKIVVTVPPTTSQADIQAAAATILKTENLVAVFGANQDGVNGFLSATADGTDLNRETGKYKDLLVVGFDSGTSQRNAISDGAFLGSVTQDPYMMGYEAIRLAVEAADGQTVQDVDTGSKWYTKENIDDPEIAKLLYD